MEDKNDEISDNKKIDDQDFRDWVFDHPLMLWGGFFLYSMVLIFIMIFYFRDFLSSGSFWAKYLLGGAMVVGYVLLLGIVYMISKYLKQTLMFMGVVVLFLLSVLLVKMIFFG